MTFELFLVCFRPLAIFVALQKLTKRWRHLLDSCQVRLECNIDFGDYSSILELFKKIISATRSSNVTEGMRHTAKSLRRTLEQFFTLIKTYVASGATGIARIIFNELSGLAASSTLRRVHKTLQQVTVGGTRGRSVTSGHADLGGVPIPSPPARRGGRGGGVGSGSGGSGFSSRRPPRNSGVSGRRLSRCFICDDPSHHYQNCPERNSRSGPSQ